VIGVPDEKCGELPRAYIVPKNKGLTESAIHKFLEGQISKHKELKGGIEFMEVIPKAPSGKILRRELKQDYLSKRGKLICLKNKLRLTLIYFSKLNLKRK
jgi:acyl-CoA synthetase (AMP-forming)/AMP-acid ligase II